MVRDNFRLNLDKLRKTSFAGVGDGGVETRAPGSQKTRTGGVADQGVLEGVAFVRGEAPNEDELSRAQLVEQPPKLGIRDAGDRRQQRMIKFPADAGGYLGDFLRRAESIEARLQRRVEAGGTASTGDGTPARTRSASLRLRPSRSPRRTTARRRRAR